MKINLSNKLREKLKDIAINSISLLLLLVILTIVYFVGEEVNNYFFDLRKGGFYHDIFLNIVIGTVSSAISIALLVLTFNIYEYLKENITVKR